MAASLSVRYVEGAKWITDGRRRTLSRRQGKTDYWQDAPMPRNQLVLIPTALEELIPADHPVRLVDEILDEFDWSEWEASYHGKFGQPPIHPSIVAKILLFSMIRRIRSSRQIEYELKHSIDFMWLSSGRRIDHTTISEFRRKNSKALRGIFKQMIKLAIDLGIANLSELCIDGTRILASANRYKTWTTERLAKALEQLDAEVAEALQSLEANDSRDEDLLGKDISADRLPAAVADLKNRREQLASHMETTQSMDETRKKNGSKGPAQLPQTDAESRILPNKEGGYAANYTPMATTETTSGLIVNAEVLIGNVEHDQFSTIVETVATDYQVNVQRVMADSAYTTGENLTAAEAKQIELIGPLAETKREDNPAEREDLTQPVADADLDRLPVNPQTKRFDKAAFVYDEAADCYYCPAGKPLPHRTTENTTYRGGKPVQRKVYTCHDCVGCPLVERCRKNPASKRGREVMHDEHEGARRRQRERMQTEEAKAAYSRRQHIGELPFAVIKSMFDMRRFLLRGIEGVGQEWRWATTAFNLKKLMHTWAELRSQLAAISSPAAN
jgi:transposase